ncbi:membrane bound C2 domain-containing protein [Cordyceps fumosorosea ARSEF 2679]|uniref:Membrane bound C2 domain-containing protein n=1 Tax=Cordyceps fumosorosea (strain ARSEF 2679) TaxID=1081104 RepID=A0A167ZH17_CORFA|nr:membrane bound C2 domain-containing protein [Cordyceps fumosorosea ARSEF 2679]OAA67505.1 membrane bound C2 domain-containing protein [Cordyceps fumosorosea ARSEF 2679]
MAADEAREAKVDNAVAAAQNPQSTVTSDDAQRKMVAEARNSGIPAFSFDPDASPEQKRAQARAAIPAELRQSRPERSVAVVTDMDDGTGPVEDLPEPSKAGVLDVARDASGKPLGLGADPGAAEPLYMRTGWAPKMGWPSQKTFEAESLLDHSTWLEGRLPDTLYGDWYHNTAIVIVACITSWLIAVLGGGLGWVLIVMATCATYYRTSLRRVRRNFRDDISREMALKKLETDNESLEWINSFMVKFWPIYQPVLAQTIINSVDQVLSSSTPAFLDSLKLKTFTLGSKPPRMEHVKTYPKTEDDIVMMDWKFSFTPNDTADLTSRQIKNKINPKIVLEIRIGKAMISKGLDVIVEDMAFSGIMRLKIKLQIPFPHIDRVEMCFLGRPEIDYVCKPLGGETFGFDINFIPGLESFILEQIHGTLGPMMYDPKVFPIEVAKMLAGTPVDQAVGVLAVTLHGAQGLKNTDKLGGSVDPYAVITFNRRQELARTKTVQDNANPRWNETHYLIVTSFSDSLDIQVFDKNDFRKSKELGVATFAMENLEELNIQENERIEVLADGKARGVVNCDLRFFPILAEKKLEDGTIEPAPESNQGILRFTVEQAKDLDGTKSLVGSLSPYADLLLNGKPVHQTKKLKRTNNPIWDNGSKEILITDRKSAKLGVIIKDDRELAGDQVVGKYQIKLDEMLDCMAQGKEWYSLAGVSTGRVKMMAQWRPVAISGVAGTGGYQTPVGVMRLHFKRASDLRNFEAFGKSDPYVRVLLSGIDKGKTVTFRNDLNPEWDEVLYVPVHSERERLTLEVMDMEKVGKDRSLGLTELAVGDFMQLNELGEYLVHDRKDNREGALRLHGKGVPKGTLHYTAAFYPCLNIADPKEEEEEKETAEKTNGDATKEVAKDAVKAAANGTTDKTSTEKAANGATDKAAPAAGHTKGKPSVDTSKSVKSAKSRTSLEQNGDKETGPPRIHMSPEQLLREESGLLIFRLLEAEVPDTPSHLEVWVDDYMYPAYTTNSTSTKSYKFDEIGDCVIRELDFSRLTLKARKKGDDNGDVLASLTGNTLDTLKQCLNNPTILKLKSEDGRTGSVKVSLKYIPIKMNLDPSESINNMGNLRVDILDGVGLPSADRNGKSDPYCRFELNGQDVFKTKIIKKTLNPTWNENFEVPVPSRTAAKFKCTVWDYDFADSPDLLGATDISLAQLEPFKAYETQYPLDGKSGSVRIRMLFRPDYVTRQRHGTSSFAGTFGAPTRIVTGVAGAPIKGGVAVAGAVGHGVGKGASFVRRGIFGKKDSNGTVVEVAEPVDVAEPGGLRKAPTLDTAARRDLTPTPGGNPSLPIPSIETPSPSHRRASSIGAASIQSGMPGAPSGSAVFTIVSASGFPGSTDLYIAISQVAPKEKTVGKTKHFKSSTGEWSFDEDLRFNCAADSQFKVEVKGNHTFGSDDALGDHPYFVDETGAGPKELTIGGGTVVIRSTFQAADSASIRDSPRSTSIRRSMLLKRGESSRVSRETTPNP